MDYESEVELLGNRIYATRLSPVVYFRSRLGSEEDLSLGIANRDVGTTSLFVPDDALRVPVSGTEIPKEDSSSISDLTDKISSARIVPVTRDS